jgi:uncharacterized protein YeaO (DUF488 family)
VATRSDVRVRRVYDEPEDEDGVRVLLDRIWPRGVTKAKAAIHEWCKDVAPTTELRKWYNTNLRSLRSSLAATARSLNKPIGGERCNTCET